MRLIEPIRIKDLWLQLALGELEKEQVLMT